MLEDPVTPDAAVLAQDPGEAHLGRLRQDMVRGSLWIAVATLASLPTSLIVNIIVAQALGPGQLGRLAVLSAGYGLLSGILNLGWSNATLQWFAAARAAGRDADEIELVRRCAGYHSFIEGPLLAVITAAYLHAQPLPLIAVAAFAVLAIQVLGTSTVILTASARNALGAKLSFVVTIVGQAGIAATASSTHSGVRTWIVQLFASILGPLLVFAFIGPAFRRAILRPKLGRGNPEGFLGYAVSACGAGVVTGLALGRSELFVLQADHLAMATGLFTLATGLGGQVTVPMDSLMAPLVPTAAGLVAAARHLAVDRMLKAIRVTSLLGGLTASLAVPLGYLALPLVYGHAFRGAQGAFIALALVSCVQSVIVPVDAFALAARSAKLVLKTNAICLVVDVALSVGLIPVLGLVGAVVANISTQLLSLLLLVGIVRRQLGATGREVFEAARVFLVGPLAAGCALVPAVFGAPLAVSLVLAVVIGASVFFSALRLFPWLRLQAMDVASIQAGLPRRLTLVFGFLTRLGALAADVPEARG